jgi:hypothetical protein
LKGLDVILIHFLDCVFTLLTDGSLLIYDTQCNPSLLSQEIEDVLQKDKVTCLHLLPPLGENQSSFRLLAGTESGQLIALDEMDLKRHFVVAQAHSAPIKGLTYDLNHNTLISFAKGKKVFAMQKDSFQLIDLFI